MNARRVTKHMKIVAAAAGLLTAGAVAVVVAPRAEADPVVVMTSDFESGTQGWFARGPSTVATTTAAAHAGAQSLLSSNRVATWQGPGRDMRGVLVKDATYAVTAHVQLVAGSPAVSVHMTVQRTPEGGSTAFQRVASASTSDSGWTQLAGEYSFSTDNTELQLYLESDSATVSFYVDDVVVTMIAPPPGGPPGTNNVVTDFEGGTRQGWAPRIGSEVLTVTDAAAHGGTRSLLTTGRQQVYSGPALNVFGKMTKGNRYTLSAWLRLGPGEAPAQLRMSLERRLNGTPTYETLVGNTTVTADGWVQLTNTYTLAVDVDFLSVYLETNSGLASFYLDDFEMIYMAPVPIQTDIPSLKDVLPDFAIGTAIDRTETVGVHSELLLKHFGSVTPGNALKWDSTEPTEGAFRWDESDALVNFAAANGLKVRGHTLVWHNQTPAWVFNRPDGTPLTNSAEDKALLLTRLENHIRAEVGRYADQVYAWDVANEVIDEFQPDGLRRSRWYQIAGVDYLRTAFRVAHEVDPDAKLFINDYNTEQGRKGQFLYDLVAQLRAEGVPIDGVGHQLHIAVSRPPISYIEKTIQKFAALGVDQQITELDMSVYTNFTDSYASVPAEILVQQGYRYQELFDVFRRQKAHLSAITIWGQSDDNTWLRTFPFPRLDLPLLFDEQLQAKPAYWGVVDPTRLPPLTRRLTVPAGTAVVDGKAELQWQLLPFVELTAVSGATARFHARWDATHLSLFADVTDPTDSKGDRLEVTVDGVVYSIPRRGAVPAGVVAHAAKASTGYAMEAVIPLSGTATAGREVGLNLLIKDTARPSDDLSWRTGILTLVPAVAVVDVPQGTPTVDGQQDAVWSSARIVTTGVPVSGSPGAVATARLLWDEHHVYVLATVTDPVLDESNSAPYQQDSVEIFVDPNNGKTVGYEDDDGQYRVSFSNRQTIGGNFDAFAIQGNLTSATRLIDGGYVIEAAIELDTVTLASGALLGFDLQVNDASGGVRTSATGWHDPTGLSYLNTSRWGVIRVVRK